MATIVGLMHLEFHVTQAASLKDKRRSLRSFKDRVARANNVSIAEVAGQDSHRRAVLAVVAVGNDRPRLEGTLQRIANAAGAHRDMILVSRDVEWL